MGWLSKLGNWVGDTLYSATGQKASAKQQFEYQKQLNEQQWGFTKEGAQNAHQWEVADLQQAGLNPVLSAGGSGANVGSASAGSASTGTPAVNPFDFITSAFNLMNQKKQTDSNVELQKQQGKEAKANANLFEQQTLESKERTGQITPKATAEIRNLNSATEVAKAQKKLIEAQKETEIRKEQLTGAQYHKTNADYYNVNEDTHIKRKQNKYYETELGIRGAKEIGNLVNNFRLPTTAKNIAKDFSRRRH